MAVYTEVADDALAAFLEDYDVGSLKSFKGIAEGVENSNYMVITDHGQFILTLYEKRVAVEDLPFFLRLMEHLAAKGIDCPVPVKPKNGAALGELAGRPAALITFLDGMWVRRPDPRHCAMLGTALAEMHIAASDFPMARKNSLACGDWRTLLETCGAEANTIAPNLYQQLDKALGELEANWPKSLPEGVIHADMFPDNVFFLGDRLSGIIDFYFACSDAFAYDIAICLNAWCFEPDIAFNITKARALLSAYKAKRPFTSQEYDALPILARGASMRFLLTRIYDWLNTPKDALVAPKDPREYLKKLRFHSDVASARAYGIDP